MFAKLMIALMGFVALSPHFRTFRSRMLLIPIAAAALSGSVGTAARLQAATMIPVNMAWAALIAVLLTACLHVVVPAVRRQLKAFRPA